MHIKNNYQLEGMGEDDSDGTGVFNGDMGVVLTVDTEEKTLVVFFDDGRTAEYEYAMLEELELAYCLSVHKSQGSEFACVVMPCVGGPPMLLTRNLFYTALTRAKELVVLVGREDVYKRQIPARCSTTIRTAALTTMRIRTARGSTISTCRSRARSCIRSLTRRPTQSSSPAPIATRPTAINAPAARLQNPSCPRRLPAGSA